MPLPIPRGRPLPGRAKMSGTGWSRPPLSDGSVDTFQLGLLQYILSMKDGDATNSPFNTAEDEEPRPKRRRVDSLLPAAVPVAQSSLKLHRRCPADTAQFSTLLRHDVGSQLKFSAATVNDHSLVISVPGHSHLRDTFPLDPEQMSSEAIKIVQLSRKSSEMIQPGQIWSRVHLSLERQGDLLFTELHFYLFWNGTSSPSQVFTHQRDVVPSRNLINTFFPLADLNPAETAWSPMDFYEAAFIPSFEETTSHTIRVSGLLANLYNYQKRTINWLLKREGVRWSPERHELEALSRADHPTLNTFREAEDVNGDIIHISDVFSCITTDVTPFRDAEIEVKGGILAEEMGLGKTLEMLGLIMLHRRSEADIEAYGHQNLHPSGATLIVVPEALRKQWAAEIARHAPELNVTFYQGRKAQTDDERMVVADLAHRDVVLTTYSVLAAELHFAIEPPTRSMRHSRVYERPKSPLVQISWWRVCLDEAQMIENGFSQAAIVAREIPRINAWGISGTPVKDDIKDLGGLLLFLKYEPYCSSAAVWQNVLRKHKPVFRQLFSSIAIRHTKSLVRDELKLPPQKRYTISMPFTAIEEQHYQSLFRQMTDACQLDTDGDPAIDGWKLENHAEQMRSWLNRLRQAVLHPEVGVTNRRALGQSRPLRTIDEVLDAMLDQNENALRSDERAFVSSKLWRGQLLENGPRVREALVIWQEVRTEAERLVAEARDGLKAAKTSQRRPADAGTRALLRGDDAEESEEELAVIDGKERWPELQRRLRSALEMLHKATFFCASGHFQVRDNPQLTQPESDEFAQLEKLEKEEYDTAKSIRRELLYEGRHKAIKLMQKLERKANDQSFVEISELEVGRGRGLESTRIIQDLEDLYARLNEQANIIDEWREQLIQLLLKPLVDEEDDVETTGEELVDSAKMQEELMVYVQVLRATIHDRQDAISGQVNELTKHETAVSLRLARDDGGPAPAKLLALFETRNRLNPKMEHVSLRGSIGDFRSIVTSHSRADAEQSERKGRAALEYQVASRHLKLTQKQFLEQNKTAMALEAEVEEFRNAMNARLEYYRQLQTVSDSVLPYEGVKDDAAIASAKAKEEELRHKLQATEAKHRYLLHLKESGSRTNEPRICVICQMQFTTGVLTVCGHQFCKDCMMMWFKAHHNCPVCKKKLTSSMMHDITFKPQQMKVVGGDDSENRSSSQQSPETRRTQTDGYQQKGIYSAFNAEKLAEIKGMELDGPSFTTKVDTIVQHLLWLREADPGAKSIIFSQYRDFLRVLQAAFRRFRIGFTSIDEPNGISRFKDDASVECFLLHARAHSSGLNLVNASHVFLCEPLLNTALELQAIARVDRIGQQHETTVWLYIVSGTVEESIHNLSVQRRMEHMGRRAAEKYKGTNQGLQSNGKSLESTPELLDESIEQANTLELEQAALSKLMSKDRTAGENVEQGDLWECLFGHISRETSSPQRGRDSALFQERAVKSFMAAEAALARR